MNKSFNLLSSLFLGLCIAVTLLPAQVFAGPSREKLLFDYGWRFHQGNDWGIGQNLAKSGSAYGPATASFSDATWRAIDLPHDWAIEQPFDPRADESHGFRSVGEEFPANSIGWYRRVFDLPESDHGRRVLLQFDGVFRDTTVFVNGWFVAHHESGYSGFTIDITDVATYGGKNVVAVRVDATHPEGWFYEGAGIYRHVWLVKTAPVAVTPDGVFAYSTFAGPTPQGPATVHLSAKVNNASAESTPITVRWQILNSANQPVAQASTTGTLDANTSQELAATAQVDSPELWSPENPSLYHCISTVETGGATTDTVTTEFGIRTVGFDAERGFLLNGHPYVLKGTCNHQDHAGVGAALPDRLQYFRIAKLKEMGSNAYRTSHNPPTPELLEACDRLGMLVMDESRLLGSDAQNLVRWEGQIRRDRNHPSVAIWSLANEEFTTQATPAGARVATTMQTLVKHLDPSRPVTYNAPVGNEFDGINSVIEVRGWSYHIGENNMDAYHRAHPQQPNVGSEQGSTVSTRGIYANDPKRGYVSAYDDNATPWSNTAEQWWSFFAKRPWLSGGFVWTGFDYRGEPTPYSWPCINSHFGILDTCGFPKDNFWYYQAWWTTQPVLHILPHWNWPDRIGQEVDVRTLSNCEEVELFLNARSLGKQTMPANSELKWKVPYAPGVLSAKGYKNGQVVAETKIETTGIPAEIRLQPDRTSVSADGEDLAIYTVSVVDSNGRVVPTADQDISFTVSGPARLLGVGNGDPSCHEADVFVSNPSIHTVEISGWKWKAITDASAQNIPETREQVDDSAWTPFDVRAEIPPLAVNDRAVSRATVTVTAEMLASPAIELSLGRLDGDAVIFINGKRLGHGDDYRTATIQECKALLHPGKNSIAVTSTVWGTHGGVSHGAALRLVRYPATPQWHRSVFNGLAQVIVRTSQSAGPIVLRASAQGLNSAEVTVTSAPATPRPAVP